MTNAAPFDARILRLIAITDTIGDGQDALVARIVQAVRGGATSVQIRLKHAPARVIADVTRAAVHAVAVPVLVNDRFDIALAAGAAGVHAGADDIAAGDIRRLTPPGFIIGTSVGCDAEIANARLADYVGIGPVYGTMSKTDAGPALGIPAFTRLMHATGKPAVGVGGITADNAAALLHAGAAGIAVIGAVLGQPDPQAAAHHIINTLPDLPHHT